MSAYDSSTVIEDKKLLAECRYHEAPYVVSLWTPHGGIDTYKYGLEYTGRYRVYTPGKWNSGVGEVWGGTVPGTPLPESVESLHVQPAVDEQDKELVERSDWYPLAAVAAAPFDYVIDPALSVVTSPLGFLFVLGLNLVP